LAFFIQPTGHSYGTARSAAPEGLPNITLIIFSAIFGAQRGEAQFI
jgi:hypothetical protein